MSDAIASNAEQERYWNDRADTWIAAQDVFDAMSGPLGRLAIDRLDPQPGQRILDIGCGTGVTSLEIAGHVAPGGHVTGVDISVPLLDHARAIAAGRDDVSFEQADAQVDDLGERIYDGAYSRFGVMFFADPVQAFTNIRKAMSPEAVLSFVCWQNAFANEWLLVPAMAAIGVLGRAPEPPVPDAPGPFALAEPERVTSILTSAGFAAIDVQAHADHVEFAEEQIPELARASTNLGVVAYMLENDDDQTRGHVTQAIEAALQERAADGAVRLARAVLLVRATA